MSREVGGETDCGEQVRHEKGKPYSEKYKNIVDYLIGEQVLTFQANNNIALFSRNFCINPTRGIRARRQLFFMDWKYAEQYAEYAQSHKNISPATRSDSNSARWESSRRAV